jgi:hypothetical protein
MALYVPGARPIGTWNAKRHQAAPSGTWDTEQKSLRPPEFVGYCTKVQYRYS